MRSTPPPHSRLGIPAWGGIHRALESGDAVPSLCQDSASENPPQVQHLLLGQEVTQHSSADHKEVAPVPPRYFMALFPGADDSTLVATPFPRWLLSLRTGTSKQRNPSAAAASNPPEFPFLWLPLPTKKKRNKNKCINAGQLSLN